MKEIRYTSQFKKDLNFGVVSTLVLFDDNSII